MPVILALLAGCAADRAPAEPTGAGSVPWSGSLPALSEELPAVRGRTPTRAIVHLHSPWSHDACDGDPLPDGAPNEPCLADLRQALCTTAIDVAFVTDHPDHASAQPWTDIVHARGGDVPVEQDGAVVGNRIPCPDGHEVLWLPGFEDQLMPVALDRHVHDDPDERHRLLNDADATAVQAMRDAGGAVLIAHTEGRAADELERLQDVGAVGIEIFNLHAMFAPDIRVEDLGLGMFDWLTEIEPFTAPEGTGEPDLLFLGVLQQQPPSLAHWDALLARGPLTGVAGTDAHQNVMPLVLRDDERGDSYRRMLRWFSNVLLVDGPPTPASAQEAIESGRLYVAFEALGTPLGFDFHLVDAAGETFEMGADAPPGTLEVICPELSARSPRGVEPPELVVTLYRDGAVFAEGCGRFPTAGPGAYRVTVEVVPHHLRPFLGDDPAPWLKRYPWIHANAIRVSG